MATEVQALQLVALLENELTRRRGPIDRHNAYYRGDHPLKFASPEFAKFHGDRYRDFSIYDVDFVAIPGAEARPPALAGMHWFGIVQSVFADRGRDWVDFYTHLLGFAPLPGGQYFGILPKGTLLESSCGMFYMQLLEPPPGSEDVVWDERLLRIGLGAPDVTAAVKALRDRGVVFIDRDPIRPTDKGALTQIYLGSVTFELVKSHLPTRPTV